MVSRDAKAGTTLTSEGQEVGGHLTARSAANRRVSLGQPLVRRHKTARTRACGNWLSLKLNSCYKISQLLTGSTLCAVRTFALFR